MDKKYARQLQAMAEQALADEQPELASILLCVAGTLAVGGPALTALMEICAGFAKIAVALLQSA